jgi:hypothetical protein
VSFLHRIDFGWLFLLSGLVLTVAAIVLPAHYDLEELESRRSEIQVNADDLAFQVKLYEQFLLELQEGDPELTKRIIEMQFNVQTDGIPVVIDESASNTPLEWIAQKVRRDREVSLESAPPSMLTSISHGRTRLFLVGIGVFSIFIGFIKNPVSPE